MQSRCCYLIFICSCNHVDAAISWPCQDFPDATAPRHKGIPGDRHADFDWGVSPVLYAYRALMLVRRVDLSHTNLVGTRAGMLVGG